MKLLIFLALLMGNILAYGEPLVIGVLKLAPPFSSEISKNSYVGFYIDLMQQICTRLNEQCTYKTTTLDNELNDLRSGLVDITFSSSPITPTTDKDYLYSLPYMPSTGQFLILNKANIPSVAALQGKKIGVIKASSLKQHLISQYTALDNIYEYANGADLLNALATHQVDSILLNSHTAKYITNNPVYNLKILQPPIDLGMGYGLVTLKKNAELIKKINTILLQIQADGTYVSIYNKYFGT